MENQNITHLLSHISVISRKYEEIAEITGENFNVFKVLGLTTNEVRTHSAFLAELLNPKGSHGCKDAFLKLFVEEFNITEFNTENAITQVEKHIGFIKDDYTEGGFIDIIIINKDKHAIIIENKIYAGDQYKQLCRYKNYGEKSSNHFSLIYLTLDGKDPSEESKGTLTKEDCLCISYRDDIINWLEQCKKEAVSKPLVRETISQYINLIKRLTNQTTNNKMSKEIVKQILESKSNFDAYKRLYGAHRAMCLEVINENAYKSIKKVLDKKKIETNFEERFKDLKNLKNDGRYWSFYIKTDYLIKLNLRILFQFQDKDLKGFTFGYAYNSKEKSIENLKKHDLIREKFTSTFDKNKSSEAFLCYKEYDNYSNWSKLDTIKRFNFENEKFEEDFESKVDFLINDCIETNTLE